MDLRKYPLDSQVMMKSIVTLMIIFIMNWSIKSMAIMKMMSWFYIWLMLTLKTNSNPPLS